MLFSTFVKCVLKRSYELCQPCRHTDIFHILYPISRLYLHFHLSSVEAKMSDLQIKVHWASLSSPSVSADDLSQSGMKTLEHVAVTVTITHPCRGNLKIELLCPSNMTSLIGARRTVDRYTHTCTQNLVQWFNWSKGNVTSVLLWLQKSIRSNHVKVFHPFVLHTETLQDTRTGLSPRCAAGERGLKASTPSGYLTTVRHSSHTHTCDKRWLSSQHQQQNRGLK